MKKRPFLSMLCVLLFLTAVAAHADETDHDEQ